MANEEQQSPLLALIQGILFQHQSQTLTPRTIRKISEQIRSAVLMTREGLGLGPEGKATNFSDNEVRGDLPPKTEDLVKQKLDEAEAEAKAKEILAQKKIEEKKAALKARQEAERKHAKTRTRAIIATPGTGEPGSAEEVGPVAYKEKID